MFIIVLKPAVLLPLIYVLVVFGFGIGINVTNAVSVEVSTFPLDHFRR